MRKKTIDHLNEAIAWIEKRLESGEERCEDNMGMLINDAANGFCENYAEYEELWVALARKYKTQKSSSTDYERIEAVIGECFDPALLPKIEEEWKAFYRNPEKYAGTEVVKMVDQWIDEQPLRYRKYETLS